MQFLILLLLLAMPGVSFSAPYVISDWTQQDVTHCGALMDTAAQIDVPVEVDATLGKRCKIDIGATLAGVHSFKATFIRANDPVWGRLESVPSAPFTFTKPGIPATPGSLVIIR